MFRPEFTVEQMNQRGNGILHGLLDIEILRSEPGVLHSRMELNQNHMAANGYLHAASVIALADTSCGNACLANLPEGSINFTTVELKSNHLGTTLEGTLLCTATAQHMGRSTQVWDADVIEEKTGKRIAMFRCTQMILWPK